VTLLVDLVGLIETINRPEGASGDLARYETRLVPGHERYRLGRRADGAPALLIESGEPKGGYVGSPVVLESVAVFPHAHCRLQSAGGLQDGTFAVVCYTGRERALEEYFLRVLSSLIASLGDQPTSAAVSAAIERVVILFRSLAKPPRKSVQGLWAELLLIARASDPAALVSAWHVTPGDRYDFNAGVHRIEVKSSSQRARRHHFSLEQLQPPSTVDLVIASCFAEQVAAGCSLASLIGEVEARLAFDAEAREVVRRSVAATLGSALSASLELCFDRQLAEESWRWYRHTDIPSIPCPIPNEISEVRFVADLTGLPTVDAVEMKSSHGLFAAAHVSAG
jgi:hypothetical protein